MDSKGRSTIPVKPDIMTNYHNQTTMVSEWFHQNTGKYKQQFTTINHMSPNDDDIQYLICGIEVEDAQQSEPTGILRLKQKYYVGLLR